MFTEAQLQSVIKNEEATKFATENHDIKVHDKTTNPENEPLFGDFKAIVPETNHLFGNFSAMLPGNDGLGSH